MNKEEWILLIIALVLAIPYMILEIAIRIKIWFGNDD